MSTEIADRNNPSQQAKVDSNGSLYVVLVNSSGTVIKTSQLEETRLGSECSGSEGAVGRILTLTNTSETGAPTTIWIEDQLVAQSDYTATHLTTSSTITFSIGIFNADTIRVKYYV